MSASNEYENWSDTWRAIGMPLVCLKMHPKHNKDVVNKTSI
jgi:hypothetical protein